MDTRTKKIGSILSIVIIVSVVLVVILVLPPPGVDGPDDTSHSQWIWISGNYTVNTLGTYGVKGEADAANVPGARLDSTAWTDASGNLWLFGGIGYDNVSNGRLNDLWRFNVSDATWMWVSGNYMVNTLGTYGVKGEADAANVPGARHAPTSWTDASGNFWLFGGSGYDNVSLGNLNDLWRFNVSDATWTWVSGNYSINNLGTYGVKGEADAANVPGARNSPTSWTDASGNLWLFGGAGYHNVSTGTLNDLWRFNVSDATWTWVSGNYTGNTLGTYGVKGEADAANVPGARSSSTSWMDASGNFWLFGGDGYDNVSHGRLNDLWRFNVSDATWTWVSGNYTVDTLGTYGAKGVADAANVPGARAYQTSWMDASGNFWLFGGYGVDNASLFGYLNDLWRFNVSAATWTWVSGNYTVDTLGTYGVKGVANPANVPGARYDSTAWTDASGNFWLFGGEGYNNVSDGYLNDLWKFQV